MKLLWVVSTALIIVSAPACSDASQQPAAPEASRLHEGEAIGLVQEWLGQNTYLKYTKVGSVVTEWGVRGEYGHVPSPCRDKYQGHTFTVLSTGSDQWTVVATASGSSDDRARWEVYDTSKIIHSLNEEC